MLEQENTATYKPLPKELVENSSFGRRLVWKGQNVEIRKKMPTWSLLSI